MLIVDLEVGDIVKRGSEGHKCIVTSTKQPLVGLKDYVTLMDPYGHFSDVWVNLIKEKVGHIDINYIFEALGDGGEKYS